MIVHCPSCSTGYHLALPASPALLRCSRCREVVPPPARRRRYALTSATPFAAPPAEPAGLVLQPVLSRVPETPLPALVLPVAPALDTAPLAPPPTPAMTALDASLFGPGPSKAPLSVRSPQARPAGGSNPADASALVPLGLAAVGAAGAWLVAPRLAAWTAALPFEVEPWMMGAAGAACGVLLGGLWVKWQAARR